MSVWSARAAWLGGPTLTEDVAIGVENGVIVSLTTEPAPNATRLEGVVVPGLVDAHSHAFHRLLRGEPHTQGGDFWVWRDRMYELAGALTPESYERIATAVYTEMALAGVTAVGEFHYVHHQRGGSQYEDPNEMGHALVRAARRAGIRICLLDAGYFRAGFGDGELDPVQERFRDPGVGSWLERVADLTDAYSDATDVVVGLAPHSVRAVSPRDLRELAEGWDGSTPLHIHLSEQPAENRACVEATGLTPTALLAEAGLLAPAVTLIHATHVTPGDIDIIGTAGSGVCYCATTERDLGDGLGPAAELARAGVSLSLGSDSHAVIDIFEEARGMEMHQRLRTGRRGLLEPVSLLASATGEGSHALGFSGGALVEGRAADFSVVDADSPRLTGLNPLQVDSLVFAATAADITDTFVAGERIVTNRRHEQWDRFRRFMTPTDR